MNKAKNAAQGHAEEVINSPASRTRERAGYVRMLHTEHTHTGDILSKPLTDHARVRARAIPEEVVAAWRERVFANGVEDPVKAAVEEAIDAFGSEGDFPIWAWYANRIGVNNFVNLYFEVLSVMKSHGLKKPAAAFHKRLKLFLAAMIEAKEAKGGAR